ncbi:MAG: hypothetical protein WHV67_03510 [Thermoanaerobaculia bacterium]
MFFEKNLKIKYNIKMIIIFVLFISIFGFSQYCSVVNYNPAPSIIHQAISLTDIAGQQTIFFDLTWGGAIGSVSYLGYEYIWNDEANGLFQSFLHSNLGTNQDWCPAQAGDLNNFASPVMGAACNQTPLFRMNTGMLDYFSNQSGRSPAFGVFNGNIYLSPNAYFTPYVLQSIATFVPNPFAPPSYYLRIDQAVTNISESVGYGNENLIWTFDISLKSPSNFNYFSFFPSCTQLNKCSASSTNYLLAGQYIDSTKTIGIATLILPTDNWNSANSNVWVSQGLNSTDGYVFTNIYIENQSLPTGSAKKYFIYVLVGPWQNALNFANSL